MENHSYGEIIGSSSAPYINSLAAKGTSAGNYFATDHPSLPNYAELTSGQSFANATSDCDPSSTCQSTAANIADGIEGSGRTWKAYEESMGSACNMATTGQYGARHDPFVYYTDITSNPARCQAHVVDYSNLATDLKSAATTPNYAFITPNVCNDMHDCSIATGDSWLASNMPAILNSTAFATQPSLLVVVFDEDDGAQNNQVAMITVGSEVKVGYVSQVSYNHYSLLRTIETSWQLATLTGNDGGASAMTDLFVSTPAPVPSPTASPSPSPSPSPTPPSPSTPNPLGQSGTWNMVFGDEFNGTALDTTKWTPGWFGTGVTAPVNSSELACYDSSHATEPGDGNLHLRLDATANTCGGHSMKYTGALISSNGLYQYTYGYVEFHVYLPATGSGQIANWPATWSDGQNWPTDGENDTMEGLGGEACYHFHSSAGGPGACASGNYSGWHTYAAYWQPGVVTYFYDGVQVGQITTGITSAPQYLIIENTLDSTTGASVPAEMLVDYVRVWTPG